jgi:hypothetical protein
MGCDREMKVWTVSSFKGYVKGVYFDEDLAKKATGPNDVIEPWEPEITRKVAVEIKELAEELV